MSPMGGPKSAQGVSTERPPSESLPLTAQQHSTIVPSDGISLTNGIHVQRVQFEEEFHTARELFSDDEAGGTPVCTYRREPLKTVVSFLLLVVSAFCNFLLLTVVHDVVPRTPLPDIVFMVIDQQHWAWAAGDFMSAFLGLAALSCVLLHRQRWIVIRRCFLLGAILFGMRAVCLGVTFLPPSFHNSDQVCLPRDNATGGPSMLTIGKRFLTYMVTMGLTSGQAQILCGDLMFSGHTVIFVIFYFVILQYTPKGAAALRWLMTPVCYAGLAMVVISGGHYTIDVLIAYWLTSHIFWAYHEIFDSLGATRKRAPLTRLWWYWACYWFESGVPDGPLPNHWSWPVGWPDCCVELVERIDVRLNEHDRE